MEEITSQTGGGEGGISKYLSTNPELAVQIQRIKSDPLSHTPVSSSYSISNMDERKYKSSDLLWQK